MGTKKREIRCKPIVINFIPSSFLLGSSVENFILEYETLHEMITFQGDRLQGSQRSDQLKQINIFKQSLSI